VTAISSIPLVPRSLMIRLVPTRRYWKRFS